MKSVLSQGPSKYGKNAKYSKNTTKLTKSSKLSSVFSLLTQPLDKTLETMKCITKKENFQRKINVAIAVRNVGYSTTTPSLTATLLPEA